MKAVNYPKSGNQEILSGDKVCIPVISNNKNDGFEIASNLNGASHYCLVDIENKTKDFIHLDDIRTVFQNSNGNGFQALNISTVICGKVSQMGLKILHDANIIVETPEGANLDKNIALHANRQLIPIEHNLIQGSSSCSSSCSSCTTGC